jgi:hypothetical protein
MQFLTVCSLRKQNPDWHIKVWYPRVPVLDQSWTTGEHQDSGGEIQDWFPRLISMDVEVAEAPDRWIAGPPGMSEVHRSDLLRWRVLAEGGVWCDFDIFFFKPLDAVFEPCDVALCLCDRKRWIFRGVKMSQKARKQWLSVGFMAGSGSVVGRTFFRTVSAIAEDACNPLEYQSCGQGALSRSAPPTNTTQWLDQLVVYPIPTFELEEMYTTGNVRPSAKTVGVHWFAGHAASRRWVECLTPDTIEQPARNRLLFGMMKECWNEVQHHYALC